MKFDELDEKMRVYETAADRCVLPEIYMVARIDGRSFTRLTKEQYAFESPFDVRVRDMMVATTQHLIPKTGEAVTVSRRRLKVDFELPMKDEYSAFIDRFLSAAPTQA